MIPRDVRAQEYMLATTWEDAARQIKDHMSNGYALTSISYGDIADYDDDDAEYTLGFFIVMSKGTDWNDQQMIECPSKPGFFSRKSLSKTISQELSKGRSITNILLVGDKFVVFSAQVDNVESQEWYTVKGTKALKQLICKNWDRDYIVSVMVNEPNDKDDIGVIFSKVKNNQIQRMTNFDYMPDPEDFECIEEDDNVMSELFLYVPRFDDWDSDAALFAAANTNVGWDSHCIYVGDTLAEIDEAIDADLEEMKDENEENEAPEYYILKCAYFQHQWIVVMGCPM